MAFQRLIVLSVLTATILVLGDDLICPENTITINDGTTGQLPIGATSMVQVAAGTNCTYMYDDSGYMEVSGMSPTQGFSPILNYTFSELNNVSLPQLIPSSMATFHIYKSSVTFKLRVNEKSDWFSTEPGKKKVVVSPNLWNPEADPNFDYTFTDYLQTYNFSINLESIHLVNAEDELVVQVGSIGGPTTWDKTYTNTKIPKGPISAIGRYLHLNFTGSKDSDIILNFDMIQQDAPLIQTTEAVETSTIASTGFESSTITEQSTNTQSTTVLKSTIPTVVTSSLSTTKMSFSTTPSTLNPELETDASSTPITESTSLSNTSDIFTSGTSVTEASIESTVSTLSTESQLSSTTTTSKSVSSTRLVSSSPSPPTKKVRTFFQH
uniref:Galectin n=1 Tax=Caenorhabditis japonica TaxID=281687 RepID=A0A8R1HZ82_CAEJA